jgi:type IV secretory pathway protease TraF
VTVLAQSGTQVTASASGFATGLVGTIGITVLDEAGAVVIPRSTAGITQPSALGLYFATFTAPALPGSYLLVWDDAQAAAVTATESLLVTSTPVAPTVPDAGRPSVENVASFIRARTKDDQGHEVGTFDDATRPTADQVEAHIDAALGLVGLRLPAVALLPDELLVAMATVVALEAACQIEKSYWPEQVTTGRSPYAQLREEADRALDRLADQAGAAAGGTEYESGYASFPVGSWTSIGSGL